MREVLEAVGDERVAAQFQAARASLARRLRRAVAADTAIASVSPARPCSGRGIGVLIARAGSRCATLPSGPVAVSVDDLGQRAETRSRPCGIGLAATTLHRLLGSRGA